jgi:hypothetical protein
LTHKEWTAILAWPGYRVYRHELDEEGKTLKLWVRRKPVHRGLNVAAAAAACTKCTMCGSGRFETCDGAYTGRLWWWKCIACDARTAGSGWKK